ncbi:MAG: deoxyribose-phosphate aldolase [Lutibacter sp.]
MNIGNYLDSTYLKTAKQAEISEEENQKKVIALINEAITHHFKLAMIRPKYVNLARTLIDKNNGNVLVGTVIGFHEGTYSIEEKLNEAEKALADGVDELDYVINYPAFKKGQINLVKSEVFKGTKIGLDNDKAVKWIIEVAALDDDEIVAITQLIKDVVVTNFGEEKAQNVFVKSSTGFFKTENGKPAGATFEAMELIVNNCRPLQAKAAGGVRSYEDAVKMVELGVSRIGTSSALKIAQGGQTEKEY